MLETIDIQHNKTAVPLLTPTADSREATVTTQSTVATKRHSADHPGVIPDEVAEAVDTGSTEFYSTTASTSSSEATDHWLFPVNDSVETVTASHDISTEEEDQRNASRLTNTTGKCVCWRHHIADCI